MGLDPTDAGLMGVRYNVGSRRIYGYESILCNTGFNTLGNSVNVLQEALKK